MFGIVSGSAQVRERREHSDRPKPVSKHAAAPIPMVLGWLGAIGRWYVARVRAASFVALAVALSLGPDAEARPRPARRGAHGRYISAQAYYHAMRAELAAAHGDGEKVSDELSLALVYDAESAYLTIRLARAQLDLGRVAKARRHADRAIVLGRSDPEAWRVSAAVAIAEGKEKRAVRELRRALRVDPTSLDAWLDLARIYRAAGRDGRALDVLARAANRVPQSAEPLAWAGEIQTTRRRYAAARQLYERARRRDPSRLDLVERLAEVDQRLLEPERAAERFRSFVGQDPVDPRAFLGAARAELILGEDALAHTYLGRAEALMQDPRADGIVGYLLFEQGRYAEAVVRLEKARTHSDNRQQLDFAVGLARYHLGDDARALAELQLVAPGELFGDARRRIVHLHMRMGQLDRAELAARAALELQPDDPTFVALLALVQSRRGHADDALAMVTEARAANPTAPALIEREVWLTYRHVALDDALERIAALREVEGVDDRRLDVLLAEVAADAGRDALVKKAVRRALTSNPDDGALLTFWGGYLAERGESLPEAQRLVREALELTYNDAAALAAYGRILFKRKKPERALPFLARAHRLLPRDPRIAEHYGDALVALERDDEARAAFTRAKAAYAAQVRARVLGRGADVDRVVEKLKRRMSMAKPR
jgi:tetratricopeptide (TPR) repeat protein